jgi:hypothetical protein
MLYREIIAVCSQIHTKHINTPCGQNLEFFGMFDLVLDKVPTGLLWVTQLITLVTICTIICHIKNRTVCSHSTFSCLVPV